MSSFIQSLVKKQLISWFPEEMLIENYRPDWLVGLEIDLYLPNLNLAIEVNGLQHYINTSKFFKNNSEFELQVIRDYVKEKIIKNESINLIVIKQGANMLNEFCFKMNYFFKNRKLKIEKELNQNYKDYWEINRTNFIQNKENFFSKQVSLLDNEYLFCSEALKKKEYKLFYSFIKDKAYIKEKEAAKKMNVLFGKAN